MVSQRRTVPYPGIPLELSQLVAEIRERKNAIPASTTESARVQVQRPDAKQGGEGHLAR